MGVGKYFFLFFLNIEDTFCLFKWHLSDICFLFILNIEDMPRLTFKWQYRAQITLYTICLDKFDHDPTLFK